MEENIKKKNLFVIVFEITVIALGIIGITFATSRLINDRTSTIVKTGEYEINYLGESNVNINNLTPMNDNLVNIDTRDNVIRLEFSVKGAKSNKSEDLIYDVMLSDMHIDCTLLNKYTKWSLYKNGGLIETGSLDPAFDGEVLTDAMHLTTTEQVLPKYNEDYDEYVLLFWLSESCNDIDNCELIDQTDSLNSSLSMKTIIAVSTGTPMTRERIPNLDNSCANAPILTNNMVPVMYKEGEWAVADKNNNNSEFKWYDYSNSIWANSVIVKDSKYVDVGTKVEDKDILAQYVWIPRYRYKLWQVSGTDSYDAYHKGIDIKFENGLNTVTGSSNNEYLTHPAFGDNLKGFWISKYEISKNEETYKFVKDTEAYTKDTLENYTSIMTKLNEDYLLGAISETHIVTNMEWGATTYLSHSEYGVCKQGNCELVDTNRTYISGSNKSDTTTKNVYGVYDMAGAGKEYVVGKSVTGTATTEVTIEGDTWYENRGRVSDRDYLLRGGASRGLYHFGDIAMDDDPYTSRSVIINK